MEYTYMYMCIYLYVCMYVCIYVCMYVCMCFTHMHMVVANEAGLLLKQMLEIKDSLAVTRPASAFEEVPLPSAVLQGLHAKQHS